MNKPTSDCVTAGVILIGNELLNGQTQDKNLSFIATHLFDLGIELKECIVIPDDREKIAQTVRDYGQRFTYVFTTGGIGPTHDDITAEAVAYAFGRPLEVHMQAKAQLDDRYGAENVTPARLQMAQFPQGAQMIANDVTHAPGFQIENVYVMAGIPVIMQSMLSHALPTLRTGVKKTKVTVYSLIQESKLAPHLTELQAAHPQVDIGSYPHWPEGRNQGVKVTLIGTDKSELDQMAEAICQACRCHDQAAEILP